MGPYKATGILILPLLAVIALLSTHKFASENGLFVLINRGITAKNPTLPDSKYQLKTYWTGLKRTDRLFAFANTFFAPCLDGKIPGFTLQSIHLLGQLASVYSLMIMESMRVGNKRKLISFVAIFGLIGEWVVMAFTVPVFGLIHLLTSPGASTFLTQAPSQRKTALLVHPIELQILPWSIFLGHLVPATLMLTSSPAVTDPFYKSRQFWSLIRLAHPIFTSIAHFILSAFTHSQETVFQSTEQRNRAVFRHLNSVYTFARIIALLPHLGALTLFILAQTTPFLFSSKFLPTLKHPIDIFAPKPFWSVNGRPLPKVTSIAQGSQWLLQWDEAIMCAAVLVWAFVVNRETLTGQPSQTGTSSLISLLLRTAVWLVIGGPAAAAITLFKERDQILLDQIDGSPAPTSSALVSSIPYPPVPATSSPSVASSPDVSLSKVPPSAAPAATPPRIPSISRAPSVSSVSTPVQTEKRIEKR